MAAAAATRPAAARTGAGGRGPHLADPPRFPGAASVPGVGSVSRGRLALAAGAVAAVAAVAAAVVFGVSNGGMRDQLSRAQASSQQVAAVLAARDATMMVGPVRGGGTVTIRDVPLHARAWCSPPRRCTRCPASRGYELWLIGPAGDRAVIMLAPARHDMTGPVIASGLRPGDHVVLTAEPVGGAARPHRPDDAGRRAVAPVPAAPVQQRLSSSACPTPARPKHACRRFSGPRAA